jgi:hypothetical protein
VFVSSMKRCAAPIIKKGVTVLTPATPSIGV